MPILMGVLLFAFVFPIVTQASIANIINFQGKLSKTSDGTNVADGNYSMQFKIYDAASNGNLLWTETWDGGTSQVNLTNGVFNVKLGTYTDLSGVDFSGGSLYLTANFNPGAGYDGEMSPRKQLTAAAFAFNTKNLIGDGKISTVYTSTTSSAASITYNPASSTSTPAVVISGGSNLSGPVLKVIQNGSGYAAVLTGGNVGIGTTSPTATVFVQGSGVINPFVVASSTGSALLTVAPNGSTTLSSLGTGVVRSATGGLFNGLVGLTTDVTGVLSVVNGGTGTSTVPTVQGQILADDGTHKYAPTTLVAGTNITITTTTPGQITIAASGGGTPGGRNTQLQYNNSNAFAGAELFYNNSNFAFGINSTTPNASLVVQGTSTSPSLDIFRVASSTNIALLTVAANGSTTISSLGTGIVRSSLGSLFNGAIALASSDVSGILGVSNGGTGTSTAPTVTGQLLAADITGTKYAPTNLVAGANITITTTTPGQITITAAGGSGSPVGGSNSLQYNNGGAFGGSQMFWINATSILGINSTSPNATLVVQGTSTQPAMPIFDVASSSGASFFRVTANGKVGVGTSTPQDGLHVMGNVLLGQVPNSTAATTTLIGTAGTFGGDTASGTSASIIYNGKLFVATAKANAAAVYRLDGATWTRVTNAAGKVLVGDSAVVDGFVMSVLNGKLFIGTQTGAGSNAALIYVSSDAHTSAGQATWTAVNSTAGTFVQTAVDGIGDFTVFNGSLYFSTQEPNLADVYLYLGGTGVTGAGGFVRVNNAAGKLATGDVADADDFRLIVYGGRLYAGAITGALTARLEYYDGVIGTWTLVNTTRGTFTTTAPTFPGMSDVTALAVYNGTLILATASSTANTLHVYKYVGGITGGVTAAGFYHISNTTGKLASADAADIDGINFFRVYNGRLYAGTKTSAAEGTAALYEYDSTQSSTTQWSIINVPRGGFGTQAAIDEANTMIDFNGTAYIGTFDTAGNGAVYTWSKYLNNSYALRFDGGGSIGRMSFIGTQQANDNGGRSGSFQFTHAVALSSGAFDYAEDYPTLDPDLEAGDVVQIDKSASQFVKKSGSKGNFIGIVSEDPGFRLSARAEDINDRYVPVALAGRVPVKVSTENGPILPGDFLTASYLPGVAAKATRAGQVVGQALEGYNGQDVGKIKAFVNVSYFNGQYEDDSGLSIDVSGNPATSTTSSTALQISSRILQRLLSATPTPTNILSELNTDRVVAGLEVITPKVFVNHLFASTISPVTASGLSIDLSGNTSSLLTVLGFGGQATTSTSTVFSLDNLGNAFFAGHILSPDLSALSEQLAGVSNQASSTAVALLSINDQFRGFASGTEQALVDLRQTIASTSSALSLSDLIKDKEALTFSGSVTFETGVKLSSIEAYNNDGININGEVYFVGRPYFTSDTAGFAVVTEGAVGVNITFDRDYLGQPIVNASISANSTTTLGALDAFANSVFSNDIKFIVTNKSEHGFTILLNKAAPVGIQFSWIALAVRNAKTFSSLGPSAPIISLPTVAINSPVASSSVISEINGNIATSSPAGIVPEAGEVAGTSTPVTSSVPDPLPQDPPAASPPADPVQDPPALQPDSAMPGSS